MNSLRLLLAQHRLLSAQLKEIEEARQRVMNVAKPDRLQRMIQALARVVGVGVETATVLVHEVLSRSFKDRRALGACVGLTGTPYNSGSSKTEQGISKNGNTRVRRMLSQLAWRWLGHQPESALAQWFNARLGGAKGRMKKVLIVALMRKLVIALWRLGQDRRGSHRRAARRTLRAAAAPRAATMKRSARTVEMRRKATSASFEPLQGGSAPLPAQASTPLQRFGPAPWSPAPDERGHDG